jgi:hypothetical protein
MPSNAYLTYLQLDFQSAMDGTKRLRAAKLRNTVLNCEGQRGRRNQLCYGPTFRYHQTYGRLLCLLVRIPKML